MEIDLSEARNLEGNAAFAAGDYAKAAAAYVEAVKANGKVAKYRTNLANTLLELGRTSEALEEAAAAVAVDPTWPKGFLFKAVAHEHLGNVQQALVVCEEGLKIHRFVVGRMGERPGPRPGGNGTSAIWRCCVLVGRHWHILATTSR